MVIRLSGFQPKPSSKTRFWAERYAILANPEIYGKKALDLSQFILRKAFSSTPIKSPFFYSESAFENWLDLQQTEKWRDSRQPHFLDAQGFSDSAVIEYLFQKAPQNLHDCAFLSRVGAVGMCTKMESILKKIKFEEDGAGRHLENHNRLYYDLISQELGITLFAPEDFGADSRFLDTSFADPVFQLAIANFPKRFHPELIGMLLLLEWTGSLSAFKTMKLLKGRAINPLYYQVHVGADNPKDGHAAQIKESIIDYLQDCRRIYGPEEQQRQWERIYQGWHTWDTILGRFEEELRVYLTRFEANSSRQA